MQDLFLSTGKKEGLILTGNYNFRSVKLELGVSGYMDFLILNTYPARSSSLHDNGIGNTLVKKRIHKRRGERCWSCVIGCWKYLHVSHVLLAFCLHFCSCALAFYGAKNHMVNARDATFLPFYYCVWRDNRKRKCCGATSTQ